jgi:restriction system protein
MFPANPTFERDGAKVRRPSILRQPVRRKTIELPGEAEIECTNCKSSFYVSGSDIYVEQHGSEERSMGAEVFYYGSGEFRCPNCDEVVEVQYEASEYPIGALNYSEVNATGGIILQNFGDIAVQFGEEMYSFDEEIDLYVPQEKKIITNLAESARDIIRIVQQEPKTLYEISPREFEEFIAQIFSRHGFSVELTQKTRDGGKDIIAVRSDLGIRSKYIIECKRYAPNRPVGVELVRSLYGVQMAHGANKSVLATTSRFTADAQNFASNTSTTKWAMDLVGYERIIEWVKATKNG